MKKATKRILKALAGTYLTVGLLLAMATSMVWEYNSQGYISIRGYHVYGEEARTTSWLVFMVSLGTLAYYTILSFIHLSTRRERERYL
jgi:hypothetical protein